MTLRNRIRSAAVLLASLLCSIGVTPYAAAQATQTISFGSDPTWAVFHRSTTSSFAFNGFAEEVCLNKLLASPPNCPTGAVNYDHLAVGWQAAPRLYGSQWIWAPGITGATTNADLAEYFFVKAFNLSGTPVSGTISVAADDSAEIFVNGKSVASVGSTTNIALAAAAQNVFTTFSIASYLRSGLNVIAVRGQNGPSSFAGGCGGGSCTYHQNPAGVVFYGSLTFQPQPKDD
jgi:hypothetical protein